jgi:predicted transcriptional regulator
LLHSPSVSRTPILSVLKDFNRADPAVPDEVIQVLLDSVADATHIRGFTPMAISAYADQFYARATAGDEYQLELILPADVFERLYAKYPDQTEEALHDTDVSLRRGSIPVSFGLWIADASHAGIVVYAEQGVRGLIINDTDAALAWAETQYERVQQGTEPLFFRGGRRRASSHS